MAASHIRVLNGAKHVGSSGGGRWIFKDLNLQIDPGEVFCLLGPSGSGKSTLLRTIAGLEPLTTGSVEIDAEADTRVHCGLVFQDPMLLPWLTVHQNIALGLGYRHTRGRLESRAGRRRWGRQRAESHDEAITSLAQRLGIADLLDRRPYQISGGQAQRVALARTVITRPDVLLLDEPFGALDAGTRNSLQNWLLDIVNELGVTTLFVTHDVDEALKLGGRIGALAGTEAGLSQVWDVASILGDHVDSPCLPGEHHLGHDSKRRQVHIRTALRDELRSHVVELADSMCSRLDGSAGRTVVVDNDADNHAGLDDRVNLDDRVTVPA